MKNSVQELNLIQEAKNGNDFAFENLLTTYKGVVNKICRQYFLVGGEVDDLMQEGMIGLYKAVKTFDEKKGVPFKTYVKTVVERHLINAIKSANSQKNFALNEYVALNNQGGIESNVVGFNSSGDTYYTLKSETKTPEDLIENQDDIKHMLKEINKVLSAFELEVLEQYLEGYTYTQIAENLNKPTKSVDNALNRIKNKLKFLKTQN